MRRAGAAVVGIGDTSAVTVHHGTDKAIVDYAGLANGVTYHYAVFYFDGAAWVSGNATSALCAATFGDIAVDAQMLVRDRIEQVLRVLVVRNALQPAKNGGIPVFLAPPGYDDVPFPVVTVSVQQDAPAERALGEYLRHDRVVENHWESSEGWLSRVVLGITGWTQNANERAMLRKAVKAAVITNLPVFDQAGLMQVEFEQRDQEDFTSFPAPMYQTVGTFSCLAPSLVVGDIPTIADVSVVSMS